MQGVFVRPLLFTALTFTVGAGATASYRYAAAPAVEPVAAASAPAPTGATTVRAIERGDIPNSFYFTRAAYGAGWNGRGSRWAVDYPQADHWIVKVLRRLTGIDVYQGDHVVQLDDPELRRYPFLYAVEVGSMGLMESEVEGLRSYLLAGGFLMADDFWGTFEWSYFEEEIRRVLPEYEIVEIPLDHPVFSTFYNVTEIVQVPNVQQGVMGGPTSEQDGIVPHCRGIFDENGRLLVVINWNTDLGDAWEWAEEPLYPLRYSTYAYQMAANFIVYAMTH